MLLFFSVARSQELSWERATEASAPNDKAVKTAKAAVTVNVAPSTTFTKSKAAAKVGDLKVGDRVVIHAKEGADEKLVADTVEFGAAPQTAAKKPAGTANAKKGT